MRTKQEIKDEEIKIKIQELAQLEAQKAQLIERNQQAISKLDEEIETAKFRKEAAEKLKV